MMIAAHCLALAIYYEARNQPLEGQHAVAEVILNRVDSKHYPDNVCDVVWQHKQFSFTHDGLPERPQHHSWGDIQQLAKEVLSEGSVPLLGLLSTHYHADYVQPYWTTSMEQETSIGNHIFYMER